MELGARVPFIRPSELATDEIRSVDVMLHAITHEMQLGRIDAKYVLMLEPTSPIRRDTLLEEAFRPILSGEATACVSVLEPGNAHPNFAMYPTDSSRVGFYIDPKSDLQSRRQECPEVLFPDGTIYASTIQALNLRRSFYHDGTYLLASSRLENLDVDTEADLYLVDLVLRDLSEDHAHRHFLEGDFSWLTNTAST